jgi:hypothetical protein
MRKRFCSLALQTLVSLALLSTAYCGRRPDAQVGMLEGCKNRTDFRIGSGVHAPTAAVSPREAFATPSSASGS